MSFEVWAPEARQVEVESGSRRIALARSDEGWHRSSEEAEPGTDYSFFLDGAGPYPDPRARWQPCGIEPPSRILEGLRPPPKVAAPRLADWVIYELHVGTFTPEGTFRAVIDRLDHLASLGINAVELMPVNTFSGDHGWGYDGVGLYAPHHTYGEPSDLIALIDACHERGFATVLDVVYNHLGPRGNHLASFGPYFTDRYSTPWGDAVNFDDAGADEVRAFFIDNALMWLGEYGFDGLRIDAVHAIHDRSAVHFLEELATEVDALEQRSGRNLCLIVESDLNDPRLVRPTSEGGFGIDATWTDDVHHALHAALTGERAGYYADFGTLGDLARALTEGYVYTGQYSSFRQRRHGRSPDGLDGGSFVASLQNHDQIGNRARGERIGRICGHDGQMIGAALLLTSPYIPLLFMGEEWAASSPFRYFTSHPDEALGRAVSEGRKREFAAFGWDPDEIPDPQDPTTFHDSKLRWDEISAEPHAAMLAWYRDLLALRNEHPDLGAGVLTEVDVSYDEEALTIAVMRGNVRVDAALGDAPAPLPGSGEVLLASKPPTGGSLQGRSVVIRSQDTV